mmetsp:Transcript_2860/g.6076  ORF Transcript_2860/g.6076 Transcript_2860/m.6076 type:complete len:337 (+) Transcript_2860:473-1483(+)
MRTRDLSGEQTAARLFRLAEARPGVCRLLAELLLDAQQLVVLGEALRAARRTRLDLPRLEANGKVRNEGILCLARAVGGHNTPASILGHFHGLNRLGDRSDLVDLKQQRVASTLIDGFLDALGVGHEQVITDDLARLAHLLGHGLVRIEIVLVEGVLDRNHRIVLNEFLVQRCQFGPSLALRAIVALSLKVEIVRRLVGQPKLRGGHVHADLDLACVAGLLDGVDYQLETLLVGEDVGREAALIADIARVLAVLLLDHALEVVIHLGAHLHRLGEVLRTDGQDHELLHRQLITSMAATVDHVECGDWHGHLVSRVARKIRNVLIERNSLARSTRLA